MRASFVNDSIHLRERAAEMRVSSKELKDNNTAAVIMRLASLLLKHGPCQSWEHS